MMRSAVRQLVPLLLLLAAVAACQKEGTRPVATAGAAATGFTAGADGKLQVNTGTQVFLNGKQSTGPAGERLVFAWRFSSLPRGSGASFDFPASSTPSFVTDVPGDYAIELAVRSDYYESAPAQLTVTATLCGQQAPQATGLAATPPIPGVGTAVSLKAVVTDADNDPATCKLHQTVAYAWAIVSQPEGSRTHLNDPAAVTPNLVPDTSGTYLVQLVVTDSTGRSGTPQTLTINANACGGNAPAIAAPLLSSNDHPGVGATFQLSANVSDADTQAPCLLQQSIFYQWTLVSQPRGSVAQLNSLTVASPSFTADVGGRYTFRLQVRDSTGRASDAQELALDVSPCGSNPPQPSIAVPASAGVGTPVQVTSTVSDQDITACNLAQTFSYSWQLRAQPGNSQAVLNAPHSVSPSFTPDLAGAYVVELTVTDSAGVRSQPISATVNVSGCGGNAPSVDAIAASPQAPSSGQTIRLTPTISDGDQACAGYDPTLRFSWKLLGRPFGSAAFLRDPTAAIADFVADLPGSYQASLQVTDTTGLTSAPQLKTITAAGCGFAAPSLANAQASPAQPDPGKPVTLSVDATDADTSCGLIQARTLRWTVSARPNGSGAAISDPAANTPTFTPDLAGTYQISVVATDSTGLRSAPAFVTLTTTDCGTAAPTVVATPQAFTGQPGQPVQLNAVPSDADLLCGFGDTFSYLWDIVDSPLASSAILSNPSIAAPTFTPDVAGAWSLRVVATDGKGHRSEPAYVSLTATGCAELPPSVDRIVLTGNGLGTAATVAPHAVTDGNCAATGVLRSRWTLTQRPLGSGAVLAAPDAAGTSFVPDVAGNYQVSLVVTNSTGLSSPAVFATLVVPACGQSQIAWNAATPITFAALELDGSTVQPPGPGLQIRPSTGAQVTVAALFTDSKNTSCGSLQVTPFRYRWALISRPAGSEAQLSASTEAAPGFIPDVPGDYQLAVQVTDALGTVSSTAFAGLSTDSCGANAPVATIAAPATLLPSQLQEVALSGSATSADSACPSRFNTPAVPIALAWTVASGPSGGALLGSASGAASSFSASKQGTYTVQLVARSGNGLSSAPAAVTFVVPGCGGTAPSVLKVSTKVNGSAGARPAVQDPVVLTATGLDLDGACGDSIATFTWSSISVPAGSAVTAPGIPQAALTAPLGSPQLSADLAFVPDVAGTYVFSVLATDTHGLSSSPFAVSTSTAACRPTFAGFSALPSAPVIGQSVALSLPLSGGQPVVADHCVADPALAIAWTLLAVPLGSLAQLGSPTAAQATLVPDVAGSYQVQVVVRDQGGFTSDPAVATVVAASCGNAGPSLQPSGGAGSSPILAAPGTPDAGDRVALSIPNILNSNGSCSNAQVTPYSARWTVISAPAGSVASIDPQGSLTPRLVPDVPGDYQLSAQVTDALGNVSTAAFLTLSTTSCGANQPVGSIAASPTQGSSPFLANANVPLNLLASATDADATGCPARFNVPPVSFTWDWRVTAGPVGGNATLSSATQTGTTFAASVPGDYTVQLIARASTGVKGAPVTRVVRVSTCGTSAPSVLSVDVQVAGAPATRPPVGTSVRLVANGFDSDTVNGGSCGNTPMAPAFVYAWHLVSAPAGSTVGVPENQNGQAALDFIPNVAGTYLWSVTTTDATGLTSAPVSVAVPTGSCGPGLTGISPLPTTTPIGTPLTLGHLPASIPDSCVAGGSISFFWSVVSRPAGSHAQLSDPIAVSPTFSPDVAGGYGIQLLATDSGGFATAVTSTLQAGGCSNGPTIAGIGTTITEPDGSTPTGGPFAGDLVVLAAPGITAGGCGTSTNRSYSYSWSLVGKPGSSSAQLSSATAAQPAFALDVPGGAYQAMLVVTDGLGNASAPAFATVTAANCGGVRPTASLTSPALPLQANAFAPLTLTAAATDNNPVSCPARFHPLAASYHFAWSILAEQPGGSATLSAATGASTAFLGTVPGSYTVRVVTTGSDGVASAALDLPIAVQQCGANAPRAVPGAGGIPDFSATQHRYDGVLKASTPAAPVLLDTNVPVSLFANVVDADATCGAPRTVPISVHWTLLGSPAGSAAQLSNPDGLNPGFTPDAVGLYTLQLVSSDDTGLSSTQGFAVTTSDCGTFAPAAIDGPPPAISALQTLPGGAQRLATTAQGTATRLAVGTEVALSAHVVDNDSLPSCSMLEADTLTWALEQAPAGSHARLSDAHAVAPRFLPDLGGVYLVSVTATDALGLTGPARSFTVHIDCNASAPVAADVGGTAAFDALQTVASVVTSGGTVTGYQVHHSTLVNPAPSFLFYPGVPVHLGANPVDADADAPGCNIPQQIGYRWSFAALPPGSAAQLDDPTSATPAFSPDVAGEYDLQLQLTDQTGLSSTTIFATQSGRPLIVAGQCGLNAPKTSFAVTAPFPFPAGTPSVNALGGQPVTFDATGLTSDADNVVLNTGTALGCGLAQPLSLQWSFLATPAGAAGISFTSASAALTSFTPTIDGIYRAQLVASDGGRSSTPANISVTVQTPSLANSTFTAVANPAAPKANDSDNYALTLTILDSAGAPIANTPVSFTSTGTAAHLSAASGTTNPSGVVTLTLATTFSADDKVVTAHLGSLSIDTNPLHFVAGPATRLTFRANGQPQNAIISTAIGGIRLLAQDAFGNTANTFGGVVTAHKGNDASHKQNATLGGTLTATASSGAINGFLTLKLNKVGAGYTIFFTATGLAQATSNPFDIVQAAPLPDPPSSLNATGDIKAIQLSWPAVAGISAAPAGYLVFRDGAQITATPYFTGTDPVTFTDDGGGVGLAEGTTFSYEVDSVDSLGQESTSSSPIATATTAPTAPVITSATPGASSVALAWSASPGETSYRVLRSNDGTAGSYSTSTIITNHSTNFTDTTAATGSTYFYQVAASNDGGVHLVPSAPVGAVGPVPLPLAPTNLVAVPGDAQVSLSWDAVSGGRYNVYGGAAGNTRLTPSPIATNSFTDTGLTNGVAQTYKVTAVDAVNQEGPASSAASATPQFVPPAVNSFSVSGGQINVGSVPTLSWTTSNASALFLDPGSVTVSGTGTTVTPFPAIAFPAGNPGINKVDPRVGYRLRARNPSVTNLRVALGVAVQSTSAAGTVSHQLAAFADGSKLWTGDYTTATSLNGSPLAAAGLHGFAAKVAPDGSVQWARTAGTQALSGAALPDGGALVTGNFTGANVAFGGFTATSGVGGTLKDVFVVRFDAAGTVVWLQTSDSHAGGFASANGISAAADGSAVLVGTLQQNSDFWKGSASPINLSPGTDIDTFLARINADGSVAWAHRNGNTGADDVSRAVAVFANGSSVVAGEYSGNGKFGTSGDAGFVNSLPAHTGHTDIFLSFYAPWGELLLVRNIGNTSADTQAYGLAVLPDESGVILVGDLHSATVLGEPGGTISLTSTGQSGFIARYSLSGSLLPVAFARSVNNTSFRAVGASVEGGAAVAGFVSSGTAVFDAADAAHSTLSATGFVAQYDAGGTFGWGRNTAGAGTGVAVGLAGSVWTSLTLLAGDSETIGGTDPNATLVTGGASGEAALARFSPLTWSTLQLRPEGLAFAKREGGAATTKQPSGLAALSDGSFVAVGSITGTVVFGTGETNSTSLAASGGAADTDAFVVRYNPNGTVAFARRGGGSGFDAASAVSAYPDGSVVATGTHATGAVFGGTTLSTTAGMGASGDLFLARYAADGSLTYAKTDALNNCGSAYNSSLASRAVAAMPNDGATAAGLLDGCTRFTGDPTVYGAASEKAAVIVNFDNAGGENWVTTSTANGAATDVQQVRALAALPDGSVVAAGSFTAPAPKFGAMTLANFAGATNLFLVKLNGSGVAQWIAQGAQVGGTAIDAAVTAAVGLLDGTVVVAGNNSAGSLTLGTGGTPLSVGVNGFVARYSADGTTVLGSHLFPGSVAVSALAALPDGTLAVSGSFSGSADFGGATLVAVSASDPWVARLRADGSLLWVKSVAGAATVAGGDAPAVAVLGDGSVVAAVQLGSGAYTFGTGEANVTTVTGVGGAGGNDLAFARWFNYLH